MVARDDSQANDMLPMQEWDSSWARLQAAHERKRANETPVC